jgi:hypothetical protein
VIEEIGDKSPLAAALVAPKSTMAVKASDAKNIELAVREVGKDVYLLACSRDPEKTSEITFTGCRRK